MGDAKPNALLSAEKYLWNFLFKLAQGEGEFMPLVDELLLVLESIDYGTLRKNELQWFNMNCKFFIHLYGYFDLLDQIVRLHPLKMPFSRTQSLGERTLMKVYLYHHRHPLK